MTEGRIITEETEKLITSGLNLIDEKDYPQARNLIDKAYEYYKKDELNTGISICLS